ncbi:hypothetical protein HN903_03810 [archaeon]|jgi:hypothetical protein|nr:hypothetical protein [archaeon]MBT7128856.1 hypothetical protein [archaeon]
MANKKTISKKKVSKNIGKSVRDNENRQLIWFFVVVGIVFAGVLVPYFWIESSKNFEYVGADWLVEDYDYLKIFHGRFLSFGNPNLHYNIFLRIDPRDNDVSTTGVFDTFKYGGVVSLSSGVDKCRGEIGRGVFDLSAFLRQGVGVEVLESGSTDEFIAIEEDRRFATCDTVLDRTLVIVEIGEEAEVFKDEKNPYCYTIIAKDCEDISGIEKFMVKSIEDFGATREVV